MKQNTIRNGDMVYVQLIPVLSLRYVNVYLNKHFNPLFVSTHVLHSRLSYLTIWNKGDWFMFIYVGVVVLAFASGQARSECLMPHSGKKEGNVLFNDALNTFYLRLYGVRHNIVKDHSDSEKGNPLPPHRLLFPINSKGSFICTIPQTG